MNGILFSVRRCVSVAILLVVLIPAILQADNTAFYGNPNDIYSTIDDYLDRQLKRLHIPGAALAVAEGSEIVHFYSFGKARPGGEHPSPTTPFILGSLTKSITAMAVMQLSDSGKINPDAPVREYLPWFKVADPDVSEAITVRQLLNQTSSLSMLTGMKQLADFDEAPDACEQRVRELASFRPSGVPGDSFEYSDVNYNILGLIIEAAGGESYDDYIRNHIFAPLGMTHSYANQADAVLDNMAVGHTMRFGLIKPEHNLRRPGGSTPSGQLISSAGDMVLFMAAMLNEGTVNGVSIVSPEKTAELVRPAVNAGSMGVDMGEYAMGWFIEDTEGGRRIWHDGMVPDFFSYMVLLPEQNRSLILLVNANHMLVNYSLLDLSEAVTDMLTSEPVETGDMGSVFRTLRLFLIIPLLQLLGIVFTINRVRRWKAAKSRLPGKPVLYGIYIILASIPHLLLAITVLVLMLMGMTKFMMLFIPDLAGLFIISGGIAFIWLGLRTWLILHTAKTLTN